MQEMEAERMVHGRWLRNTRFKERRLKCSECGFDSDYGFNFCPYCGAQMDSSSVPTYSSNL